MFTSDVKQTTPFLFFWFVIERVHMMHSNMAFRSHLMQQFAAVARNQSRPPIALSRASLARREQFLNSPSDPTLPANQSFEQRNLAPLSARISNKANANFNHVEGRRVMSLEPGATSVDSQEFKDPEDSIDTTGVSITSSSSPCQDVPSLRMLNNDHRSLLDRIILGAQFAPSHGRHSSENCSYMRLISQAAIDTVSEIAYHVTLKRRLAIDPGGAHAFAERKKKRWSQIPAYLVALVRNQPDQVAENAGVSQYLELPYVPPATALQLADYGASYSAVNYIVSRLHAAKVGTKLVSDHILTTSAFRELIGAASTDRVVAMIMVGCPFIGHLSQEPVLGYSPQVQDL